MKRYGELVNEHNTDPETRLFDDMVASVLKALVSHESESDVKVEIGR